MNRNSINVLAIILVINLLPSCTLLKHKTSKKKKLANTAQLKQIDSATAVIKKDIPIDTADSQRLLIEYTAPIWQKRIELKTISAKAKMHYESGDKSFDFVANIRMRKDSIIWVSVTVAGIIQITRAVITPDSFKLILYTEKQVFAGAIEKANEFLPPGINFYSLQNLLLGNPILNKSNTVNVADASPNWVVRFEQENYIEQALYDKTDSTLRQNHLITQGVSNKTLTHILSNFETINGQKIATERKLNAINDSTAMQVDMSYSNILIDEELSYPFSIPKNYTIK
ncbi:MAG: DUF4292 domain-containing protein [Phycisphaerales bacterium]|nr:DUF4292 domain-containing protein [Phycisphaerales bacterium]